MKQNTIIILLTAVAVLLLVNLIGNRFPPTAQAAIGAHSWNMSCANSLGCYIIGTNGHVTWIVGNRVTSIGTVK